MPLLSERAALSSGAATTFKIRRAESVTRELYLQEQITICLSTGPSVLRPSSMNSGNLNRTKRHAVDATLSKKYIKRNNVMFGKQASSQLM